MNKSNQLWLVKERIKHCYKMLECAPNENITAALQKEIKRLKLELVEGILSTDDQTLNQIIAMIN